MAIKIQLSNKEFIVSHEVIGLLEIQISNINKKMDRLKEKNRIDSGMKNVVLQFEYISDEILDLIRGNDDIEGWKKNIFFKSPMSYTIVKVSNLEIPNLSNWKALGVIKENPENNSFTISNFNSKEPVPLKYFEKESANCDHCGKNRHCNSTFIIRNNETSEEMQIGKSCLKNFVQQKEIDTLIFYTNIVDAFDNLDIDKMSQGRPTFMMPKLKFLASIDAIMNKTNGFIKRDGENVIHQIKNLRPSTNMAALHLTDSYYLSMAIKSFKIMDGGKYEEIADSYYNMIKDIKLTDENYKNAKGILNWFATNEIEKNNDFNLNLSKIMTNDAKYFYKNDYGIAGYSFAFKKFQIERINKEKENSAITYLKVPDYVGDEGYKIKNIDVKITGLNVYSNDYSGGSTYEYYLSTRDGRSLKYSSSSNNKGFDAIFDKYDDIYALRDACRVSNIWINLRCTVKGQNIYKDTCQTLVRNGVINDSVISNVPISNGFTQFNEKYILREFKISKIEDAVSRTSNEKQYKYTVENVNGMEFIILSYFSIEAFKVGNVCQTPTQYNGDELVGILPENINIIGKKFNNNFEEIAMTIAKALKFNKKIK